MFINYKIITINLYKSKIFFHFFIHINIKAEIFTPLIAAPSTDDYIFLKISFRPMYVIKHIVLFFAKKKYI